LTEAGFIFTMPEIQKSFAKAFAKRGKQLKSCRISLHQEFVIL